MDLFLRTGQDPLVMMSWRCKNLEEIVIHGYVLDPHNIVGISRLRGRTLKRLEVSMIDSTPNEANMDSFIEVCSLHWLFFSFRRFIWSERIMNGLFPKLILKQNYSMKNV